MTRDEQARWIAGYLDTVPNSPGKDSVLVATSVLDAEGYFSTQPHLPRVLTVYGSNMGIGTTHEGIGAVGGPFFTPSSVGQQLEVVSTSANDAAAGTGMRTIRLVYERADNTIGSEDVTLNGTGAVSTIATDIIYLYPQFSHGLSYGTGGLAAGNVDIRIQGGGAVVERILVGRRGIIHSARTRIPPGYTGFVFSWSVGVAGTHSASFDLAHTWDHRTKAYLGAMVTRYQLDTLSSGWFAEDLPSPMALPETTELEVTGIRTAGSDAFGAAMVEVLLMRNS